jgi:hypothetical protein
MEAPRACLNPDKVLLLKHLEIKNLLAYFAYQVYRVVECYTIAGAEY